MKISPKFAPLLKTALSLFITHHSRLITRQVWQQRFGEKPTHTHTEERGFGDGAFGNRVIFLNSFVRHITPVLYWKIRDIAERAVASSPTHVEVAASLPRPGHLGIRCIELLQYTAGRGSLTSQLGWHRDDGSVYTMVLQLSQVCVSVVKLQSQHNLRMQISPPLCLHLYNQPPRSKRHQRKATFLVANSISTS